MASWRGNDAPGRLVGVVYLLEQIGDCASSELRARFGWGFALRSLGAGARHRRFLSRFRAEGAEETEEAAEGSSGDHRARLVDLHLICSRLSSTDHHAKGAKERIKVAKSHSAIIVNRREKQNKLKRK